VTWKKRPSRKRWLSNRSAISNLSLGNGVEKSTHAMCGLAAGIGVEQPATALAVRNSINLRMMNIPMSGYSE
jgi:hypothetical protein